jgi:hypothetical protein
MFDPGNLVKQAVNSFLPKDMAVVGDVAGAIFDLNTGNPLGAAQLGMDAMKDLPQATKSLQQQQGQQGAAGARCGASMPANPTLEPSPPPQGKPIDMASLLDILKQLTALLSGAKGDSSKAGADTPGAETSSKGADTPAKTASPSTSTTTARQGTTTTTTTTTTRRETTSGWRGSPPETGATAQHPATQGWRGEPRTPAPSPTTQTPAPATTAASSSSAPASSSTPTSPSTPASSAPPPAASSAPAAESSASRGGETISSMAQLNTMSDSAIRDAVIHGRISPELAKDQTAMMAIQQRMNAISEMNNLMTNMMKALHDMQMAVIQNIRA